MCSYGHSEYYSSNISIKVLHANLLELLFIFNKVAIIDNICIMHWIYCSISIPNDAPQKKIPQIGLPSFIGSQRFNYRKAMARKVLIIW